MNVRTHSHRLLVAVAALAALRAQEPIGPPPPRAPLYTFDWAFGSSGPQDDFWETYGYGGFRFQWPELSLEIRGRNGLLLSDRTTIEKLNRSRDDDDDELPRREIEPPKPRRALSAELLQQRAARLLAAAGSNAKVQLPPGQLSFDVPRFLYFEGGVQVYRGGVEVVRCERMWISPLDDRIVIEDAELRWQQVDSEGNPGPMFVVRGKKLIKQGPRWTGRDLEVTSCEAGKPHAAIASGELELVEREGQFEVWSRGNVLKLGGESVLPLPDAHFFSADQSGLPLRGVRAGYSNSQGVRTEIDLGMPMQDGGGKVHEWLTGRPAHEFRGDWNLGLGWIEKRGSALRGEVDYRGKDLYQGRTEAFYMDDDGPNIREIVDNIDGTPIDARNRNLLRTENRVFLGKTSNLDLTAFFAGDPAVYSEFFRNDYRSRELPESSVYLHHASDNVLVTATGRFQANEFSYRDDRALADAYVEELPVATVHWLAEPIATTPWDTPIVLDTATEVGQRRRAIDDRSTAGLSSDQVTRADQLAELSAPFHLGPITFRPFAQGRFTYYDDTQDGDSADRVAMSAGVRAGTRFSRTWNWLDDHGREQSLRHVVSPVVSVIDRYHVSGNRDLFVYDANDQLTEQNLLRFEVRNLVQRTRAIENRPSRTEDVVFLDIAQDVWPDKQRDNQGESLGLLYYDFLIMPQPQWWPTETLQFGIYGDHDWDDGLRTLDAELTVGKIAGLDWTLDYRTDALVDAAAGIGTRAQLLGNWDLSGNVMYDFDNDRVLTYYAGLRRDDHDWTLMAGLNYDPFSDEITFRIEVQPRLFGSGRQRGAGSFGLLGDDRRYPSGY